MAADYPYGHAPQVVQPGLEAVDQREKVDPYHHSYGPEVVPHQNQSQWHGQHQTQSRNPFGLSPLLFALLVGTLTAIIVGGAVGGGVGSVYSSCKSSKSKLLASSSISPTAFATSPASASASGASSASSTTSGSALATATGTVFNYTPTPIRDVTSLALDCPSLNNTTWSNHFTQNFTYTCNIDLGNLPSLTGGNISDIAAIIAYTPQDCIDACSAINFQTFVHARVGGTTCSSVTFFALAKSVLGVGNGNCWLKNGTLAPGQGGQYAANAVSAQLN